jgi:hypothetical protein
MEHMRQCPQCGAQWECGDANYQDECPFPTGILCLKCWARRLPAAKATAKKKAAG